MATSPLSIQDFAAKIRSKNPGAYDDLSDSDLASKVVSKFPQYSDMIAGTYQTKPGAPTQNVRDTSGQQTNYAGLQDIVPKEGETFGDTMKRAIEAGRNFTPDQLHQQAQADLKLAPAVVAAAPVVGAAGAASLAGLGALGGAAAGTMAPTATTEAVGTGILDSTGSEIMKDVTTYGPSLLRQYGAKAVQPMMRYAVRAAGLGGAYEVAHWIGKQL